MDKTKAQPFSTSFLLLSALFIVMLNIASISDLVTYSEPPCITGEMLAEAGVLVDVSQGNPPGVCESN